MTHLLRLLLSWSARRLLIFVLLVVSMIAVVKVKEAYDRIPAIQAEVEFLQRQQAQLAEFVGAERQRAIDRLHEAQSLEEELVRQRLALLRQQRTKLEARQGSSTELALDAVSGNGSNIAGALGARFRLQLLRHEEAALRARLSIVAGESRANSLAGATRQLDGRIAQLSAEIGDIERRYPFLVRVDRVPLIRDLLGPWQELRDKRAELQQAQSRRTLLLQSQRQAAEMVNRAGSALEASRNAISSATAPGAELEQAIRQRQDALAAHWAIRAWEAAKPVLGPALWVMLGLLFLPPAVKAFWFFIVAPAASRLRPIRICPNADGEIFWSSGRGTDAAQAKSAVSWSILLNPDEELLIRPEYLQSSIAPARAETQLLLSWAIPLGSLATGLFGLTRIRVEAEAALSVGAGTDMVDEVGVIEVPAGSAVVFKPRALIGLVQPIGRPARLERVWQLRRATAWLTLQLRHLVFHGPCALVVKGARGVALEPARQGRRLSGAATMGWSAGLSYSVDRSETFLAYMAGKQSLFVDRFEGPRGSVIYEQMPRARSRGTMFGRGLEGLGDALLKPFGL